MVDNDFIKKHLFRWGLALFYFLWCAMQLYILFSGNRLSGYRGANSLIASRRWIHTIKYIFEGALYFSFVLDSWIAGYKRTKSVKQFLIRMLKNMILLLLIFMFAIFCNFIINNSMNGYLNYFEPLFVIVQIMILNILIGIFFKSIRK